MVPRRGLALGRISERTADARLAILDERGHVGRAAAEGRDAAGTRGASADGAIMTPSPRWQAPRSSGWMPPPGSSCAIPTRPRTPSRRRSSEPGVTCPHCAAPIASTPGSTGCSYRACIDEARRLRRHRVDVELTPIDSPSVDDGVSVTNDRDQLERGFSRLEPEARALIVLHHYLDLPLPEVAIALGIPLGTAKSRLHRALGSMRAALDADARPRSEITEGRLA